MSDDIETLGLGLTWEQLPVGRRFRTIGRTITEADLVGFINCTGMVEVLFTNIEYLRTASEIIRRVVPGALVYSFSEGLLIQSTVQGAGLAFLGMELKIDGPTFVGDTIHVVTEVTESRESRSRPGAGLVRTLNKVTNQDGNVVMTYNPLRLIKGANWKPTRRER